MDEPSTLSANALDTENNLGAISPSQILFLEQEDQRLYVELIQILRDRQMGWLRPICLCKPIQADRPSSDFLEPSSSLVKTPSLPSASPRTDKQITVEGISYWVIDMRQSSDLLWPLSQCNIVLDIDAIPILTSIDPDPPSLRAVEKARKSLNAFMKNIWQKKVRFDP